MSKRELVDTGTNKRYIRRAKDGKFDKSTDIGRSLFAELQIAPALAKGYA